MFMPPPTDTLLISVMVLNGVCEIFLPKRAGLPFGLLASQEVLQMPFSPPPTPVMEATTHAGRDYTLTLWEAPSFPCPLHPPWSCWSEVWLVDSGTRHPDSFFQVHLG